MNETNKLYLKTTSSLALLLDLLEIGLASIGPENLAVTLKPGVNVHYIGRMVKTPAVLDVTKFPPVETTPAEYYADERANVLLAGDSVGELRSAFDNAAFKHGTEILPEPENPKAVWA